MPLQDVCCVNYLKSSHTYLDSSNLTVKEKRKMTPSMFFVKQKIMNCSEGNGCIILNCQEHVIVSPANCFTQIGLMHPPLQTTGFNDWKHENRIHDHERSIQHRKNVGLYIARQGNELGKIDTALHQANVRQVQYW